MLPDDLIQLCPALPQLVLYIHVNCLKEDNLIWNRPNSGEITPKDSHNHLSLHGSNSEWVRAFGTLPYLHRSMFFFGD